MTGKADTGDAAVTADGAEAKDSTAADKDEAGKAMRPRRIVRSRSTAVIGEGDAAKPEGDVAAAPAGEGADGAAAGGAADAAAPSAKDPARPRHDMRAPAPPPGGRPRPQGGRGLGPRPEGTGGAVEGMPARPPRPGAMPQRSEFLPTRPPRPGALPSEGGRRPFDPDRPRPPRGDRPGGPRRDGPGGPGGSSGPRRDGPPRGDRPRFGGRPDAGGAPQEGQAAAPVVKPAAPVVKPAAPAVKPAAPVAKVHKAAPPAPLTSAPKGNKPTTVLVPLSRAGQAPAANKPAALTAKEALAAKTKAAQAAKGAPSKHEEAHAAATEQTFAADALAAGWDDAKAFVAQAGEAAVALVDAWLAATNATAIAAIADANDTHAGARKAARRAIAVLKSRGVHVPERPKAKAEERSDTLEATMIPCDSFGTWSVAITSRDPGGRYRIAEVIAREPAGVIQAAGGWLSGSQLKEGRARAQSNVGMAPVVVPIAWARARVAQALALNAKSGQVVPLNYESCRELIEVASETVVAHPLADLDEKVTAELAAERAKTSASLHDEAEFAGWLPERRALDEMMQKVGTRLGAGGVRDAELVNTALREEADAATDRYFGPETREQIAARMRDSAISVRARKGEERALEVLAVARAVKEAGLITAPPREIPFLTAFFQKALGALARMGGGQLRIPVPQGPAPAADAPAEGG